MMQQINLLQFESRRRGLQFDAQGIAFGVVVFIAVLMAFYGYQYYMLSQLQLQLQQEEGALAQSKARTLEIRGRFPKKVVDPSLEPRLQRNQERQQQRQQLLKHIAGDTSLEQQRFSPRLQALIAADIDDLWLTEITISGQGDEILLQGITQRSHLVPLYLQGLARQSVFKGASFQSLQIDRTESTEEDENPDLDLPLRFSLRTQLSGEEKL